jgi:solute carrier family 25 protein 44
MQVERQGEVKFFSDLPRVFKEVTRESGLRGLYKGYLWWQVVGLPSELVYFGAYNFSKSYLAKEFAKPSGEPNTDSALVCLSAGVIADFTSTLIWVPVDVVSSRLMIQSATHGERYKNGVQAFLLIAKEEGFRGLWKGFGASVLATAPASATWWLTYEKTKQLITRKARQFDKTSATTVTQHNSNTTTSLKNINIYNKKNDKALNWREKLLQKFKNEKSPLVHSLSGAAAGIMASLVSNPIDVIKVRLQTQDFIAKAAPGTVTQHTLLYKNTFQGLKTMVREEGLKSLTRGLLPRILLSAPVSGVTLMVYEYVLRLSAKKQIEPTEKST